MSSNHYGWETFSTLRIDAAALNAKGMDFETLTPEEYADFFASTLPASASAAINGDIFVIHTMRFIPQRSVAPLTCKTISSPCLRRNGAPACG